MKTLILTAINDNHPFWYEQLVPFILSLTDTDYAGDIGVISYGLSAEKENVLRENGILVFAASHRFPELTIDRQYTTAQIATQYQYDQIALYDTDIWFPNKHLSLFEQLHETDKLYACFDPMCMPFIFDCVRDYGKEKVQKIIQDIARQQGYPWQVGLLAGYAPAWQRYQQYLDTLLTPEQFTIKYGIDTTTFNLYAAECHGAAHLPERYNCLPFWGLHITNIGSDGNLLTKENNRFLFKGEPVEGIHVTGIHRYTGRSSYDYRTWREERYIYEGIHYRHHVQASSNVIPPQLAQAFAQMPQPIQIQDFQMEGECLFHQPLPYCLNIRMSGISHLTLHNPTAHTICFEAGLCRVPPHSLPYHAFAILNKQQTIDFDRNPHVIHTVYLNAGGSISFMTRDINTETNDAEWRFIFQAA